MKEDELLGKVQANLKGIESVVSEARNIQKCVTEDPQKVMSRLINAKKRLVSSSRALR